jgi:pimeloyl-ACP methyl ester carboxylesterase
MKGTIKMKKHKVSISFDRRLARKVGKIMLISFATITLCIIALVAILLIQSPGKVKSLMDKNERVIEGSISEKVYVEINGVKMGMIIKSKNTSNPVLLFVHGGPGMPEYPLTETYPTGLEEYFTVVWWNQRGAGLSYSSDISSKTMTTEQFVSDTIKVTNYLRERFRQDKIYLMGHSWGSYIGIQAAEKSPELYHAYIGVGQISNLMESEKIAYEYMLNYYKVTGDEKTVKKLEAIPIETFYYLPDAYNKIRDNVMHRAGIGTTHKMKSVVTGIFMPVMQNPEYTLREKMNIWRGKAFSNSTVLHDELYKADLSKTVTKLDIPIYFFSGIYDYTVNYSMSEAYLKKLSAPVKGFYLFKESAHSPIFEEPEKVVQIIRDDVLKCKNDLADTY